MTLDRRLRDLRRREVPARDAPRSRRRPTSRSIVINHVPAFAADTTSGIVPLTLKLAQQNETYAVSYCTEAGLFQDGGAPAIICGPGDIAQAHTANEFVASRSWRSASPSSAAWPTGLRAEPPAQ